MDARRAAEEKIREAQERGAFDNLPGAGKPLDLGDVNDPHWFVKSLIRREKIDPAELAHPTVLLRRERESFPAALADVASEAGVRAVLEEFNARVKAEWRRPQVGPSPPVVARLVDVERMLERWRDLRAAQAAARRAARPPAVSPPPRSRRRWWRFRSGRAAAAPD